MYWIYVILLNIIDKKIFSQANYYIKSNSSTNCVSWNEWTNCKGLCGETGYMTRYHNIKSNGISQEFNYEWKTCNILGCTINNYTESVKENYFRMQELNYLEHFRKTHSIILDKCISDYCDYNTLKKVLTNNIDRFWNALICVKHNLGCPVKGGWSKWSSWSKCTATCGSGIQYRIRNCDHPKPSKTSLYCSGNYLELKNCYGKSCTTNINGTWCKWSNWSKCSVQQGNGIMVRKRFCQNNNNFYTSCLGPNTEINQCYMPDVNGGWSEWQKWSPCSAKCGEGTRYRTRSCSRPEPEQYGHNCIGEYIQINVCYVEPCKGSPIMVATFNKQSHLKYSATEIKTTLLYITIRFYPFNGSGIILRRFHDDVCDDCDSIQLDLIDCRLILTVSLKGCNFTLLIPSTIQIGWNEVYFTVTKNKITLQLNNEQISKDIKCVVPISIVNFDQVMSIGENFEGLIEKLHVNFIPYALTINDEFSEMYLPYAVYNTIFELSEEQSYANLSKTIRIPCPQPRNFWKLELYLRFEFLSHGNFITIRSITTDYMLVEIIKDVIKLKIKLDDYFDEVLIKFEEIDSSWIHVNIEQQKNCWVIEINGEKRTLIMPEDIPIEICQNYLYIGNLEENQDSTEFQGIIGYLKLNDNILNPNDFLINPFGEYDIFSQNLSDISYNEISMTNEEDVIELNCIFNNKFQHEDLDIVWLKSNQPILYKINCNKSNNCLITTNNYMSQITIFPKMVLQDYFYLCISMTRQKIICIYGVTTVNNIINEENVLKTFIIFGKLIAIITILFFIILIKKIK